ncbi:MAG: lipopolysaccharide biosynthesis protein [Deltaproteobacteria bacterium]|nr:lipopolysaccharide biosynthesis protein [Deltaproteobacteria bacterium]
MWVFTLRVVNRGFGFIRTIILARLLIPEDFGILGIAMLAASTLDALSQTGIQAALVNRKGDVNEYLDVAWTTLALRGVFLFAAMFISAPFIARFFESDQSRLVIMVTAVNMLLTGFGNIGIVFFQKEMEFNKQFIYELMSAVVDLVLSISLAFVLRNVWALVWGGMAKNITRFFLSYILHPYRPRLRFDREKFNHLFGYGMWISGSTILIFLVTQGDDIFVGKILGVTALGFYQMAYLLSNLPTTEISDVISRVSFPAYSKLQMDPVRLRSAYVKVLQITTYVSVPIAAGIFILGKEFTAIFLGPKWLAMVPALKILAVAGLVGSITATAKPVFLGVGKPQIDTILQVIRLLILVGVIYPLSIRWGIAGAALAVLMSASVSAIGFTIMAVRVTAWAYKSFIKVVVVPLANAAVMIFVIMIVGRTFDKIGLLQFLMLVGIGMLVYFCMTFIFEKLLKYGMIKIIKEIYFNI